MPSWRSAAFQNVNAIKVTALAKDSSPVVWVLGAWSISRRFFKAFLATAWPFSDYLWKNKELSWLNPAIEAVMPSIQNLGLWNLICLLIRNLTGHIWSILIHIHIYWTQLSFNSNTTAILTSGLQTATGAKHPIKQKKVFGYQPVVPSRDVGQPVNAHIYRRTFCKIWAVHNPIQQMLSCNDPNGRQMKWKLLWSESAYEIFYCLKLVHQVLETLSKLLCPSHTKVSKQSTNEYFTFEFRPASLEQQFWEKGVLRTCFSDN